MAAEARSPLMTHLVAFFPSRELSLAAARGMIDGGARYLEVQFPFSDPSADGPLIQTACSSALEAGFTVARGFELVGEISALAGVPVFIMSYANLVVRRGVESFVERAKAAGAAGLIVPDLMPGSDERLYEIGARSAIEIVPVVAPDVSEERLALVRSMRPAYLYAALRAGITGRYTALGSENHRFLDRLRPLGARILAGFGVSSPEQVAEIRSEVHASVVGSALVRIILDAAAPGGAERLDPERLRRRMGERVRALSGPG